MPPISAPTAAVQNAWQRQADEDSSLRCGRITPSHTIAFNPKACAWGHLLPEARGPPYPYAAPQWRRCAAALKAELLCAACSSRRSLPPLLLCRLLYQVAECLRMAHVDLVSSMV